MRCQYCCPWWQKKEDAVVISELGPAGTRTPTPGTRTPLATPGATPPATPGTRTPPATPGGTLPSSRSNDMFSRVASFVHLHAPRYMSYEELCNATNNFSHRLGDGGYGTVFRGTLLDDQGRPSLHVAVKRMKQNVDVDLRSFEKEVTILARLSHKNLVRLRGWCTDQQQFMIVYELLPNGSLEKFLFAPAGNHATTPLLWERRFRILLGVANALSYLHEGAPDKIVVLHRDLKPNNILLDEDFEAKLGDFGLSRELEGGRTGHSTIAAGTRGYLAPEMLSSNRATKKTDMYSLGVVMAELACGQKAIERAASPSFLMDRLWQHHERNCLLDMADQRLQPLIDEAEQEQVTRVLLIALVCCHPDPDKRPSISTALQMLKGNKRLPHVPLTKPRIYYAPPASASPEASAIANSSSSDTSNTNYLSATLSSQTDLVNYTTGSSTSETYYRTANNYLGSQKL